MILFCLSKVEGSFQEMLCKLFGVEDEEELPKEVQGIDVVKFAELTAGTISSVVVSITPMNPRVKIMAVHDTPR